MQERRQLEHYIAGHPGFLESLRPWPEDRLAPRLVKEMIQAGARVDVGPMAAVAGSHCGCRGPEIISSTVPKLSWKTAAIFF